MARLCAIIPARKGSKKIKNKNIRLLNGHPLIAYSIAVAKLSPLIEQTIVTTDSQQIADIALKYGAEVPFLRPENLALDYSTDMEFFQHFIDFNKKNNIEIPEYLVHLRPTTPLRELNVLNSGIQMILDHPEATSLRSVNRTSVCPYKIFKMDGIFMKDLFPNELKPEYYNLPRQVFPEMFDPNGYVDVVRYSTIQTGMLHGKKMIGYVTEKIPDIDEKKDFEFARKIAKNKSFLEIAEYLNTMT